MLLLVVVVLVHHHTSINSIGIINTRRSFISSTHSANNAHAAVYHHSLSTLPIYQRHLTVTSTSNTRPFSSSAAGTPPKKTLPKNSREYLYYIDIHGQNLTSCFKDKRFLDFFYTRLQVNQYGWDRGSGEDGYQYHHRISRPHLRRQAHLAGDLHHPFDPSSLYVGETMGRIYHPAPPSHLVHHRYENDMKNGGPSCVIAGGIAKPSSPSSIKSDTGRYDAELDESMHVEGGDGRITIGDMHGVVDHTSSEQKEQPHNVIAQSTETTTPTHEEPPSQHHPQEQQEQQQQPIPSSTDSPTPKRRDGEEKKDQTLSNPPTSTTHQTSPSRNMLTTLIHTHTPYPNIQTTLHPQSKTTTAVLVEVEHRHPLRIAIRLNGTWEDGGQRMEQR
ncbi:hypothetical protein BC829DRAFT_433830 [Chytridium lagenaria]|nr:hypothetical protein BC829DRAFT_433830 [Chytridium lagenaria]